MKICSLFFVASFLFIFFVIAFCFLFKIDEYLNISTSNFRNFCNNNDVSFFFKYESKRPLKVYGISNVESKYEFLPLGKGSTLPDKYGPNGFCIMYKDSIYNALSCSFFKRSSWRKFDISVFLIQESDSLLIIKSCKSEKFFHTQCFVDSIYIGTKYR